VASARADRRVRLRRRLVSGIGLRLILRQGLSRRKAADGARFSQNEMTAAHRHLPLGTKVMVENRATGEQVEVKITDRGPYADPKRRIIDLSKAAADSIGLVEPGISPVQVVITEEAAQLKRTCAMRAEEAACGETCQLHAKSLPDAFLVRKADGAAVVKREVASFLL
jgi:rare lipoprotein A